MLRERSPSRPYLLSPVPLTPNGRAHLGHVAGPLLKADILARHLRRRGDFVVVASASDPYESHVLLKAYQEKRAPEEVCNDYHAKIDNDLKSLDIVYDEYVNPLDPKWRNTYDRYASQVMEDLVASEAVELVEEQIPCSPSGGRDVIGGWLTGRCPQCFTGTGGYFCEQCGTHFKPQDMVNAAPRLAGDAPVKWRQEVCLYLRFQDLDKIFSQWEKMSLREDFQAIVKRYLVAQGPRIRLTNPGTWGIPWSVPTSSSPQVIFTYSALLYSPNLVSGDVFGDIYGSGINAFDPESGVTTITCFGVDNAVPYLVGVLGSATTQKRFKPFDHFLVNYFYDLEGGKFSTSRGHVIWAADIVELTPVSSDLVRFYLTLFNPEFGKSNFDLAKFVEINNRMVREVENSFRESSAARPKGQPSSPSAGLIVRLEELLRKQDAALDPSSFFLRGAGLAIQPWFSEKKGLVRSADDHAWWLKGASLLLYPIMPKLGRAGWLACGHDGEPATSEFMERRPPRPLAEALPIGQEVEIDDLSSCFPDTLRSIDV